MKRMTPTTAATNWRKPPMTRSTTPAVARPEVIAIQGVRRGQMVVRLWELAVTPPAEIIHHVAPDPAHARVLLG